LEELEVSESLRAPLTLTQHARTASSTPFWSQAINLIK
jgi:hypothetical protein